MCSILLASFSGACGEAQDDVVAWRLDENTEFAPPESVPLDELNQAYATVMCDRIASCCSPDEISHELEFDEFNIEACRRKYSAIIEYSVRYARPSLADGRNVYHADRAASYLRRIAEASCVGGMEPLVGSSAFSFLIIDGVVEIGEACGHDDECRDGVCEGAVLSYDETSVSVLEFGTCEAFEDVGDACELGSCRAESYCVVVPNSVTGETSLSCQVRDVEVGGSCANSLCVEGAYCDGLYISQEEPANLTCMPLRSVGERCTIGECNQHTFCNSTTVGEGECVMLKALGEACHSFSQCGSGRCDSRDQDETTCRKPFEAICTGN